MEPSGYLKKRKGFLKGWRSRFFRRAGDVVEYGVFRDEDEEDLQVRGSIPITKVRCPLNLDLFIAVILLFRSFIRFVLFCFCFNLLCIIIYVHIIRNIS